MSSLSPCLLIGLMAVLLVLCALVLTKSSKKSDQDQNQYQTSLTMASGQNIESNAREVGIIPVYPPTNSTPIAMPGSAGRLVTAGSQSNPPEPGGYIVDSEISEISNPVSFRIWNSYKGMYPRSTLDSDSYGTQFYPTKTGHYVRSGYW